MNGRRWAWQPLMVAGAWALTTGAVLAQNTGAAPTRKLTGETVTATIGQARTSGDASATVQQDPSLGTVYTFHGNAKNGGGAPAASGGSSATSTTGNGAASAPALGSGPVTGQVGTPDGAPASLDNQVITFHGGRHGPDPSPGATVLGTQGASGNDVITLHGLPNGRTNAATPVPTADGPVFTYHGGQHGPDGAVVRPTTAQAAGAGSPRSTPTGATQPAALASRDHAVPVPPESGAPSRAPQALPPLPPLPGDTAAGLKLLASAHPFPSVPGTTDAAGTIPAAGNTVFGAVVSPSSPDGADDSVEEHWATLMQDEANHLTQESSVPMTVVVVRTRDEVMRRFIAQTVMHQDLTRYTEADSGLSALFSMGSRVNNSPNPTCYILFRRDKIGALRDQFLAPMSAKVGEAAAVAFLVGHETGHCLDYYERQRTFPTKGFWTSSETSKLGIAPAAAHRLFPNGMTPQAYTYASAALYGDLAQRQYEERIADAFGVMWAVHRGFPARLFDDVIEARKWIPRNDDHSTLPALVGLRTRYDDLQPKDVAHLWALARQVQQDVGVDASVGDGVSSEAAHFNGEEKFYGPNTTSATPVDPTQGSGATVVGHNQVVTRPFGQAYPAPEHPIEPPPTVVGRSKAPAPKAFGSGGSTFDALRPFGSSTISGM